MPILGVDFYHDEFDEHVPDMDAFWALGRPWHFMQVKTVDGASAQSFGWRAIQEARHAAERAGRYNESAFVAWYAFVRPGVLPAAQAEACIRENERSGLLAKPSMIPWLDLEGAGWDSAQHVVDVVGEIAARIQAATGRPVGLYGRTVVRENHVKSRMGCAYAWNPSYTATEHSMPNPPWPPELVPLWQYTGDDVNKTGYPDTPPLPAWDRGGKRRKLDCTVWKGRTPAEAESLDAFRETLVTCTRDPGVGVGLAAIAVGLGIKVIT